LYAPAATPHAVVARLNQGVITALGNADLREKFAQQGLEIESGTPDQLTSMLKQEVTRWGKVIKAAKIQGE
jgi:tripartite-type tricarboxylate transporter receptor subunit TctC